MTDFAKEILVCGAILAQSTLHRPYAHRERPRYPLHFRADAAHVVSERGAHLINKTLGPGPLCDREFETVRKNTKDLGISPDHRQGKRLLIEDKQIVRCVEANLAFEV